MYLCDCSGRRCASYCYDVAVHDCESEGACKIDGHFFFTGEEACDAGEV
jgi:hypothetical protein